jgi:hypothetical protein
VHQTKVQGAKQQDLDRAVEGEAAADLIRLKVVAVVVVVVVVEQADHLNESGAEGAEGQSAALVFYLGAGVAGVEVGREPGEFDCELVEGAGVVEVPLVEVLFALEVAEVEALTERSQRAEGVEGVVEERLPRVMARFPLLLATMIWVRREEGLFFGWVVEAAWCPCSVKWEQAVVSSLQ